MSEPNFESIPTHAASELPRKQSPFGNNFFKFFFVGGAIFFGGGLIILLGAVAMFIFLFLVNGSDIGTSFIGVIAFVIGQFLFVALVIYLVIYLIAYGLITIIRSTKKRDEQKPNQVTGEVLAEIKNNKIKGVSSPGNWINGAYSILDSILDKFYLVIF